MRLLLGARPSLFASFNLLLSLHVPHSLAHNSWIGPDTCNNSNTKEKKSTTTMPSSSSSSEEKPSAAFLVVATRIHLGEASEPPSLDELESKLRSFARFCVDSRADVGVVAVDAGKRQRAAAGIGGDRDDEVDLVDLVRTARDRVAASGATDDVVPPVVLRVLPVQPWGRFAPALNALVSWACNSAAESASAASGSASASGVKRHRAQILFASAETTASAAAVQALREQLDDDGETLVAGLVLPGHDYMGYNVETALNGRTTPWNTLALWDLHKLALTGFQLVSEGLVAVGDDDENPPKMIAGVEEAAAIAVLQKLLGADRAKAKLVRVSDGGGVDWDRTFGGDRARQEWHERKMESKVSRAAKQLQMLGGLTGVVLHC